MKPLPNTPAIHRIAGIGMVNNETGTFTDPQTGLIEKQDQKIVTPPKG